MSNFQGWLAKRGSRISLRGKGSMVGMVIMGKHLLNPLTRQAVVVLICQSNNIHLWYKLLVVKEGDLEKEDRCLFD